MNLIPNECFPPSYYAFQNENILFSTFNYFLRITILYMYHITIYYYGSLLIGRYCSCIPTSAKITLISVLTPLLLFPYFLIHYIEFCIGKNS